MNELLIPLSLLRPALHGGRVSDRTCDGAVWMTMSGGEHKIGVDLTE
ncbi:MAG: hypothetical protein QQN63_12675 [Nitrosopumilus sp.]